MEHLRIIATEGDVLVLAAESGERYSLALDETLRAEVRRSRTPRTHEAPEARVNPRDIQAQLRAGLSVEEVASLLGVRTESVARYESPVAAEREHIVGQALAVPVLLGGEVDPSAQPTFGVAVRGKLAEAGATGERWTSWKDGSGWIVKLEFVAADVDHDARWTFDPKRASLAPQNSDAVQLSRQGPLPDGLIPRLRALEPTVKDHSDFDSAAFGPRAVSPEADFDLPELRTPAPPAVRDAAIKRAPDASPASGETADLLEALRRRRGQREPLPGTSGGAASGVAHAPVALFDALEPGYDDIDPLLDDEPPAAGEDGPDAAASRKRGRMSMPSWDEIVFGARTDD